MEKPLTEEMHNIKTGRQTQWQSELCWRRKKKALRSPMSVQLR